MGRARRSGESIQLAHEDQGTTLSGCGLQYFLTPLASSIFAPGVGDVLKDFHSTSSPIIGPFVVSIYVLGYLFGPFLIVPMSELYGRLPVYHVCNALFLIFTIACALAQTLPQLFVFRFFAGVAGVCPLVIGPATAADMIIKEKRAGVLALLAMGHILGPVVGPVSGGFLSEKEGWRCDFWVVSIATGVMLLASVFCYRESYAPVLLERKAARLRRETGDTTMKSRYDMGRTPRELFLAALARPLKLLFRSPIVLLLCLFAATAYGYLFLMFTTITPTFENTYGFSQGSSSVAYLGFGVGCLVCAVIFGRVSNRIAVDHSAQRRLTPESLLLPMMFGSCLIPIGLFWYGWSVDAQVHWIMPVIGTSFFGAGLIIVFMSSNTYLVDAYLRYAASVTAAITILRSLFGTFLPLAGAPTYNTLGLGWWNSQLGFIALALCLVPILL